MQIRLFRPYDRHPSNHFYGDPFDAEADTLIGGESNWSSPREDPSESPTATIQGKEIGIELHEDGPVFEFFVQNVDQVPAYVSAIAALISAWAAARALRKRELPKDDFNSKSGTVIEVGDIRIESTRDLQPQEVTELAESLARFRPRPLHDSGRIGDA